MTRYSLKVPQFQILIGSDDITDAVVGYSFRHPLAEPSTPLIWTGTIELYPVRSGLPRSFFDDELNPSRWLSGLQPIDVYFNGTWWQRFRIKPSGYRFNQDNGQAEIEITDIIGILDEYQPSADAPEFKTGANNFWNDLAVRLIARQAALMGTTVTVETPPYGIGGFYQIPRTVSGSYIKEAQKMAGERGIWMWSDKETIKWAEYPQTASSIAWRRSRRELLNFTRQQGLDPVKSKITVSTTHEEVDTCGEVYPKTTWVFASSAVIINSSGGVGQRYQTVASRTIEDKVITNNHIFTLTKSVVGNPMLVLFGGTLLSTGVLVGDPPEVKGWKRTKLNAFGGFAFFYRYEKKVPNFDSIVSFVYNWTDRQDLLLERDVTTYENVPLDAQNASKILRRVITRSEPYAKFPDGLQYFDTNFWFRLNLSTPSLITERITTTYTYREIFRDDIIVTAGQKLYEIDEIVEFKEQIYFEIRKQGGFNPTTTAVPRLVPQSKTVTKYVKECQGRWKEIKEVWQNKGRSTTTAGYLYSVDRTETPVTAIPDIIYRPAPFPVRQKPLLGAVETGYAGVSPYVNSNEFANASTLTTKAECEQYARMLGRMKWQRYYGRELAGGFSSTLGYAPFQGVQAGNGSYIRDRFGVSLNNEGDSWQFVEDAIGNKTGSIPEIQAPPLPYPPLLVSALNIGAIANLSFVQNLPISPITFYSTGGQTPYTYSSTTLPTGLSLSSGGVLSGTPTAIATTSVTVTVTDSLSATDTTSFDIAVVAAPIPLLITSETIFSEHIYSVIGEMSFLNGIRIPAEVGGSYKVTGEMFFLGEQPEAVVGGTYKVIGEMSFLTLESRYKVIGEMSFAPSANPLLAKTLAFWTFDETSGDRLDSHGSNDLSPVAAMDYNIGLNGNSLSNREGLSIVSDSVFDASITGFIGFAILNNKFTTGSFGDAIIHCGQWRLVNAFGEISLAVGFAPSTVLDYNTGDPLADGAWHLINIEIDVTGGTMSIRVDNGALVSTAILGVVETAQMFGGGTVMNSSCGLDNAWVYNSPLNADERSELWNNGIPLTYPFTTPQTNITIGDLLVGGTIVDGSTFTTDAQSILSSATITALNSVTIYGLNRATNYEDYLFTLSNGSISIELNALSGYTNPTYGVNGDYTFVASGLDWLDPISDPVPSGNYSSANPLSAAIGEPLNSPWRLTIEDQDGGSGDATFAGWSFNVDI